MPIQGRPTREQMLADLQASEPARPTREQMLADLAGPTQKGKQVYDQPVGPEQASAVDRFKERVQDPQRWNAAIMNKGPYAQKMIEGDAPLILPGGAIPKLTKAAVALAEGKGLAYALGRTALSTGQGAVMSAAQDGPKGEKFGERYDRIKDSAKLSGGIQLAAESIPVVGKGLGWAARKSSSALTGETEQVIKTYANETDDVNRIIKSTGGDTTSAYDKMRDRLFQGLEKAKTRLNQSIGNTLETNPGKAVNEVNGILKEIEETKKGIDPDLFPEALKQIDSLLAKVQKVADRSGGKVSAKDLNSITQFLQDAAESAYNNGGQVFIGAKESAKAAKGGAAVSRLARNQASPELAADYAELQKIRGATKHANKNLLAPGRSDSALNAAGSGQNPRNEKVLESLGKIAGMDALGEARKIAAARSFASPSWFPTGSTGKTAGRLILGAGTGYMIDGEKGAMIGAGLTSPAMLKVGINTLNIGKQISAKVPSFAKFTRENPVAAQAIVQLVSGQIRRENAPREAQEFLKQNPQLMQDAKPEPKGEDRWAARGMEKLGIKEDEMSPQAMKSKEVKRLLIEASDMKPGSPGMNRILKQIESMKGLSNDSRTGTETEVLRLQRKPSSGR